MSQRSLPFLILVLIVLGGVAWWVTRDAGNGSPAGASTKLLQDFDGPPDVVRLRNSDGTKEYRVERRAGIWYLTEPVKDEASEQYLEQLVRQLAAAEKTLAWPDGKTTPARIREAGLDPPRGSIVLARGGKTRRIEFGAESFPPGTMFARVDGDYCRITQGMEQLVEINLDDFRNALLFRASGAQVERLDIRRTENGQTTTVHVERKGRGFVVGSDPEQEGLPADSGRVAVLLANLLAARARRFFPIGAEVNPPPATWLEVRVLSGLGSETVRMTDPQSGVVYATKEGRPSRMEVDSSRFVRLVREPVDSLISTQLWSYGAASASKIRVRVRGQPQPPEVWLERDAASNQFRVGQPLRRWADPRAVNDLIEACEQTRLVRVLSGAAGAGARRALERPEATITLSPPAGQTALGEFVVTLAKSNGTLVCRRNDESVIYAVLSPGFDRFARPWWQYLEPTAFVFSGARPVLSVAVETAASTRHWVLDDTGRWLLGGKPDDAFDAIYDQLRKVAATRVIGPEPSKLLAGRKRLALVRVLGSKPGQKPFDLGTLALYAPPSGTKLWSRAGDDPVVYELAARASRELAWLWK